MEAQGEEKNGRAETVDRACNTRGDKVNMTNVNNNHPVHPPQQQRGR